MKSKIIAAIMMSAILPITTAVAAFPEKPVNYVIPFGPGGESDITARHQQSFFKDKFGQNLVISYKPGGGGAVGWSQLNQMRGDGSNIMGINLPHIIVKPQQKNCRQIRVPKLAGPAPLLCCPKGYCRYEWC